MSGTVVDATCVLGGVSGRPPTVESDSSRSTSRDDNAGKTVISYYGVSSNVLIVVRRMGMTESCLVTLSFSIDTTTGVVKT